ncbi:hypothetical protein QFZ76_002552 [Streptomyces sp. V4I2]|nr:hypothetical protein [Streptomyces sp. V4I2]
MSRVDQAELDRRWNEGLCARCLTPFEPRTVEHVYCSRLCRQRDEREAERPEAGHCGACGASLEGRRADARWCSDACRMRAQRAGKGSSTP